MIFLSRKQAGRMLAEKLAPYKNKKIIIVALPRGGVPVAAEIASALKAPLEVLLVRKIGVPFQPELAAGALCEEATPIWSAAILAKTGLEPDNLSSIVKKETEKIKKQRDLFRGGRKFPFMDQKTVIVVDDGLATGSTMQAAVQYLRKKGAVKILVAVPIAAQSSAQKIRTQVDELIALQEREDLISVGEWYQDFDQVTDEEVLSLLRSASLVSMDL